LSYLRQIENLLKGNSVMSQFGIKLNHRDTVTLSYTGIISVFLFELSGSVVKKQIETVPQFSM